MRAVDIHEAKVNLCQLVQAAVDGDPFIITRDGKPLVRVVSIETPDAAREGRTGFMAGMISVPADFDSFGSSQIESMFEGEE